MKIKQKTCICGNKFIPSNSLQKYCSPLCFYKNQKIKKRKPVIRKSITHKRKKNPLNDLLDKLWSKAVKILANNKCEFCGGEVTLNSHHFYGRRNYAVRWEVKNGFCLCVSHHKFSTQFSAHETPSKFTEWAKEKRGQKWYDKLEIEALQNRDKPDKEKLLKELKEIVYGKEKPLPF